MPNFGLIFAIVFLVGVKRVIPCLIYLLEKILKNKSLDFLEVGHCWVNPGKNPDLGSSRLSWGGGKLIGVEPMNKNIGNRNHLLAMPVLANAHDHGRGLRPLAYGAVDEPLESWLQGITSEPRLDPYLRAAVAFGRLAESGVGVTAHCHNTQDHNALLQEAQGVAKAAKDVGIRVAFAVPFLGRNGVVYGPIEPLLAKLPPEDHPRLMRMRQLPRPPAETFEIFEAITALENECFAAQYFPLAPQWLDDETLAEIAQASADTGRRIHMHLMETPRQYAWAQKAYPEGLLRHLDAIGLLSPRLTVAHGVWLTEADCELLAERGVSVSANASSNLRLRSGLPPMRKLVGAGVKFGLGLDGMALDDDEDMLREMRLSGHLLGEAQDAQGGYAALMEAVCVNGRYTITGPDGGGVLQAGAPADVLVLDTQRITEDLLDPHYPDLLDLFVGRATKRDVDAMVVAGRSVVEDGRCVGVDLRVLERELMSQARESMRLNPPDRALIGRVRQAVDDYYRKCSC